MIVPRSAEKKLFFIDKSQSRGVSVAKQLCLKPILGKLSKIINLIFLLT